MRNPGRSFSRPINGMLSGLYVHGPQVSLTGARNPESDRLKALWQMQSFSCKSARKMPNHGDLIAFLSLCKALPGQPACSCRTPLSFASLSVHLCLGTGCGLWKQIPPGAGSVGRRPPPLRSVRGQEGWPRPGSTSGSVRRLSQRGTRTGAGRVRRLAKPDIFLSVWASGSAPHSSSLACSVCQALSGNTGFPAHARDPSPSLLVTPPVPFVLQAEGWER